MIDISLDEFSNKVKESFKKDNPYLTDKEVNKYFESDEVKKTISDSYKSNMKRYETGKITFKVFTIGCVASVAFCLTYMYE